mmetsp:Transcript_12778/g.43264  ORF Transcript_12778/g.43264 Transcript_12778/m.43264 type:complete len:429 (-) Transcript_12778:70-1356(-)
MGAGCGAWRRAPCLGTVLITASALDPVDNLDQQPSSRPAPAAGAPAGAEGACGARTVERTRARSDEPSLGQLPGERAPGKGLRGGGPRAVRGGRARPLGAEDVVEQLVGQCAPVGQGSEAAGHLGERGREVRGAGHGLVPAGELLGEEVPVARGQRDGPAEELPGGRERRRAAGRARGRGRHRSEGLARERGPALDRRQAVKPEARGDARHGIDHAGHGRRPRGPRGQGGRQRGGRRGLQRCGGCPVARRACRGRAGLRGRGLRLGAGRARGVVRVVRRRADGSRHVGRGRAPRHAARGHVRLGCRGSAPLLALVALLGSLALARGLRGRGHDPRRGLKARHGLVVGVHEGHPLRVIALGVLAYAVVARVRFAAAEAVHARGGLHDALGHRGGVAFVRGGALGAGRLGVLAGAMLGHGCVARWGGAPG